MGDEVSDSSSDEFNFQGEYKAFQIRAEIEDDSAWEINEVTRTRQSDKNCFQESQDNYINEHETPEDPNKLCSKRPGKLIRLKSEVSKLPSQKVIDKHNLTHLPHAKWCLHCVEGRAVKDQSLTVSKSERNKRTGVIVQIDFFEFHSLRVLAMVEATSGYLSARIVKEKAVTGTLDPKVEYLVQFLKEIGHKSITLQSDQEDTVMKICELAAERFKFKDGKLAHSITTRATAPYSSNPNGSVERASRLIRDQSRVMFGALVHKFNTVFEPKDKFINWFIRHVCWIINRAIVKKDGRTRFEHLYGRSLARKNLFEFLSPVVCTVPCRKKASYTMDIF